MTRLYTRTGDQGETYCPLTGRREPKYTLCLEVYGVLDEAQSWLGFAAVLLREHGLRDLASYVDQLQSILFRLGFHLAGRQCLEANTVRSLEHAVDFVWRGRRLDRFLLHGGNIASASLAVARSIVRRLERILVKCFEENLCRHDKDLVLAIVNRASDLLFALEVEAAERLNTRLAEAPSCPQR